MKKPKDIYSKKWIVRHGIKAKYCNLCDFDRIVHNYGCNDFNTDRNGLSLFDFADDYEELTGSELTIVTPHKLFGD